MHWYTDVLKKYAVFGGRASRQEFWMFVLFNFIVQVIISGIDAFITGGIIAAIYTLAVLLPAIGVSIRRLHDTDRSGWWLLLSFVPFIGIIVLIIFYVLDSTPGSNRFGDNPKGA
jgi:uncharacterized membrane protein YhaH (DUF805 family)